MIITDETELKLRISELKLVLANKRIAELEAQVAERTEEWAHVVKDRSTVLDENKKLKAQVAELQAYKDANERDIEWANSIVMSERYARAMIATATAEAKETER